MIMKVIKQAAKEKVAAKELAKQKAAKKTRSLQNALKKVAAQKLAAQQASKKKRARQNALKKEAVQKLAKQKAAKKKRSIQKALKKELQKANRLKNFYNTKYMLEETTIPVNVAGIGEFTMQLTRKDRFKNDFPKIRATLLGGDIPVILRATQGYMHWTLDGGRFKQRLMKEQNKQKKEILTAIGEKFAAALDQLV